MIETLGEKTKEEADKLRLEGVYKQRGDNEYCMVRLRQAGGRWTAEDLVKTADLSDKYSNGTAHLAVRQDIQLHWIKYSELPDFLYEMKKMGLISRDACGNCVRNVTACPGAGVCEKELVDAFEWSEKLTKPFLGNTEFEKLPRKFKISVSGCDVSCALPKIQDVGLVAIKRSKEGKEEIGFEAYLAGGLGKRPKLGKKLVNFIPLDLTPEFTRAVCLVFNLLGDRTTRSRSRLKFVLERMGTNKVVWSIKDQLRMLEMSESNIERIEFNYIYD